MGKRTRKSKSKKSQKLENSSGKHHYSLRKIQRKNIAQKYGFNKQDNQNFGQEYFVGKRAYKKKKRNTQDIESQQQEDYQNYDPLERYKDYIIDQERLDVLTLPDLKQKKQIVEKLISKYRPLFIQEQLKIHHQKMSHVGQNSIPINADVRNFNWAQLDKKQMELTGRQFDVIMMDPPWKLSSSQPSRGVAIQYDSLSDQDIEKIDIKRLQKNGFLMIWCINAKYRFTIKLMEQIWGYKIVDTLTWVKMTVNGKIAKGHGFYLQHAKQTCIIGVKGQPRFIPNVESDVIFSQRRGQSQKPQQVYEYVQKLVPNGYYLQIFGRRNNLRDRWVTIGNEI